MVKRISSNNKNDAQQWSLVTHIPSSMDDNLVFCRDKPFICQIYPSALVKLPLNEGICVIAIHVKIV